MKRRPLKVGDRVHCVSPGVSWMGTIEALGLTYATCRTENVRMANAKYLTRLVPKKKPKRTAREWVLVGYEGDLTLVSEGQPFKAKEQIRVREVLDDEALPPLLGCPWCKCRLAACGSPGGGQALPSKCDCKGCGNQIGKTSALIEELSARLADAEAKLKIAVNAMRSAVGFEPFQSLNPRPLSEALAKIRGEK